MYIEINPILKKNPEYEVEYRKLRELLEIKKVAQQYTHGMKKFQIKDKKVRYNKNKIRILKHDKIQGPFALVLFKTGSELASDPVYTYQGRIIVEEGEYAYVYRDSLEQGYIDAYFCDDNTMVIDVRNKSKNEKYALKIDGEPTNVKNWDFTDNDDKNHTGENLIKEMREKTMKDLNLGEESVYGIIQLDC